MKNGQVVLEDLNTKQAIVLSSLFTYQTDKEAIKELGWSNDKFYRYKREVIHLKDEAARGMFEKLQGLLIIAAHKAICKLAEMLDDDSVSSRLKLKIAGDILDRAGFPKQKESIVPSLLQRGMESGRE